MIKPAALLFYLLIILVFFAIGILYAGLTGAAEGQGLAGGAIVFFYGIISAFLAFIFSLFVVYKVEYRTIVIANRVLGILFFAFAVYSAYRIYTRERKETPVKEYPKKTTAPATMASLNVSSALIGNTQQKKTQEMGLGFFKPDFFNEPVLNFYGDINPEKPIIEHWVYDSMTFKRNEYNQIEIATAPPWLVPDHLKMDYNILYFRVLGIAGDFVKIVGNKSNQQVSYVSRNAGKIIYWPEFLLGANSVEFIDGFEQQIRVRPFDYAGEVNVTFEYMKPLIIQQSWMKVLLKDNQLRKVGEGWIRWQKDDVLLVKYSLLS